MGNGGFKKPPNGRTREINDWYRFAPSRRCENASEHGHGPVNTNGPQGAGGLGETLRQRERSVTPRKRRTVQL